MPPPRATGTTLASTHAMASSLKQPRVEGMGSERQVPAHNLLGAGVAEASVYLGSV